MIQTADWNLWAAWASILTGMLVGAGLGTRFLQPGFAAGYTSPRRRLLRLGHVSFFGLGFVNLAFWLSLRALGVTVASALGGAVDGAVGGAVPGAWLLRIASAGLLVGLVSMPVVCFLTAWRERMRHAFFLPVASLVLGVGAFLLWGILR